MSSLGFAFTAVAAFLLLRLPRQWAALPLVLGAAYMTLGQVLEVGPLHFPVIRLLILVGFARVLLRGEQIAGGLNQMDLLLMVWAGSLLGTSVFHSSDAWILRLGVIWTDLGSYLLFRVFVQDARDVYRIIKSLCLLLVPVALAMLLERMTGKNWFAGLGGVLEQADYRHGRYRASGPFASAILSGTVGAGCLGMALCCWRTERKLAWMGILAAGSIVVASGASGPVMMVFAILVALGLWRIRERLAMVRWFTVLLILALNLVMNDPVYYLMARIDITGGSTGWHRAALMQAAIEHLDEWWFAGTDHTRHWMPTGIYANANHTDITNQYLQNGVWGGLPLMALFIGILLTAFRIIGKALHENEAGSVEQKRLIWTLGCVLFGHAINFLSIAYFDQSIVFFYLLLASIGMLPALKPALVQATEVEPASVPTGYESDFCHYC